MTSYRDFVMCRPMESDEQEPLVLLAVTFAADDPRPDKVYSVPISLAYVYEDLMRERNEALAEIERLKRWPL